MKIYIIRIWSNGLSYFYNMVLDDVSIKQFLEFNKNATFDFDVFELIIDKSFYNKNLYFRHLS